jgi:arginyl-tRNA synthetase
MSLYAQYAALLDGVLDDLVADGVLPNGIDRRNVTVEPPRDASHGDLATNAAMVLAKGASTNPRALAEAIKPKLEALPTVTSVDVAGPGFINLRLMPDAWRDELKTILREGEAYGLSKIGNNERVNVEYVSANPTGPLHMGHCRGAVVGDSLARVLEAAGFRVTKEYYVNDAGAQVDTLARSLHLRYRETLGEDIGAIPEGLYPGDYLKPVGAVLAAEFGDRYAEAPESEWLDLFRDRAIAAMIELIRHDLGLLDIHHDLFSSEAALQKAGAVEKAMQVLHDKGLVYQGTLERPKSLDPHEEWEPVELTLFRSTEFGDDQDRPMKKSDGSWTYFGSDAAYHWQKAQGGRSPGQHLGRGPCRDGEARPVRRPRFDRRQGRSRRQDHQHGAPVPRRRAGEDVQTRRRLRHARGCRGRGRQGRGPIHDADQAGRHPARLRLRQGGRGIEGQPRLLRAICPRQDQFAEAQGGGCRRRSRGGGRPVVAR